MNTSRFLRPLLTSTILHPAQFRAMHIQSIPMCKSISNAPFRFPESPTTEYDLVITSCPGVGSSNNYAYLVSDDATNDAVIIDPANPPEVGPILRDHISSGQINLTAIV